jgi:hypothetical protein
MSDTPTPPPKKVCRNCASFGHATHTCWQRPMGSPTGPDRTCDKWTEDYSRTKWRQ